MFTDRNGNVLEISLSQEEMKKIDIGMEGVSPDLIDAVIAAEDRNFFHHHGIDVLATLRAIKDNLLLGKVVSGGSTITQQVARNYYHLPERTLKAKIMESLFALRLEKHLSKSEILELWLNRVSFGGNIIGVGAAAEEIFGKSAGMLDLAESAFLAGIPQSPERFHPFRNFDSAKSRQEYILRRMEEEGFIASPESERALAESLVLTSEGDDPIAPHFIVFLHNLNAVRSSIEKGETQIRTSIDRDIQMQVQNLVLVHLKRLKLNEINNAAVLVWDTSTGEILAYIGNSDFQDKGHSGEVDVLSSERSVGSTLKPFLYLLAFERFGWTGETLVYDDPSGFETSGSFFYEPQNYDLEFRGEITIREALGESRNIPAVKLLAELGDDSFYTFLRNFGISVGEAESGDYGLSSALGSFPISPLELARAYGILASGGRPVRFHFLPSSSYSEASEAPVASCSNVFELVDILSDETARINSFGTENPLDFPYAVAAKTGTTRNFRDNWTVGFSEKYGILVWVGNADGSPMKDVSGITGAAPLFAAIMDELMQNEPIIKKFVLDEFCRGNDPEVSGPSQPIPTDSDTFRILTPISGQRFILTSEMPRETQKIRFSASGRAEWFVDGDLVGSGQSIFWIPVIGSHEIVGVDGSGRSKSIEIEIR